ncbi:MAG: hypothetical protein ABI432_14215 [Flavobacteriales bacterium]
MKKWIIAGLVMCGLHAKAQDSGFGAGLLLGDPTGISLKYWLSDDRALDGGLAWGTVHSGYFHVHADYLFHNSGLISVSKGKLPLYYGPGLRMRTWSGDEYWHHGSWHDSDGSHVDLGVRFPVGLAYLFEGAPVDIFLEIVPTLDLIPSTAFELDGGIGARYWF